MLLTLAEDSAHRAYRTQGAPFPIRGRVRTGCLTCRSRKLKCSEEKPVCVRCAKAKRPCTWKTGIVHRGHQTEEARSPGSESNHPSSTTYEGGPAERISNAQENGHEPSTGIPPSGTRTPSSTESARDAAGGLDLSSPSINHGVQNDAAAFLSSPSAQALMTSQDIYLCTTIDLMAATEAPQDPTFSYFIEEVQVPLIAPFDSNNWYRLKIHIKELGASDRAISAAILAVQAVYRAQTNALPTTHAMSVSTAAHSIFRVAVEDEHRDFYSLLVIIFLLCLNEIVVPTEAGSIFMEREGTFIERLEMWSLGGHQTADHALPFALRIVAYLKILHAAARRGGGPGLLSSVVSDLLVSLPRSLPSLPSAVDQVDAPLSIYDMLSIPVFDIYVELQIMSAQVAELSHYHRSRVTSADQEEVAGVLSGLKARLSKTWAQKPSIMQLSPIELRTNLSQTLAEPLITVIGLCTAVFHTEIVEIGRTLSDPPLASSEARQHMRQILSLVEGDWNAVNKNTGKLNAGYLRPLFLCAIESISPDHTQWAIERIRQINDHICRSDFFASFARALVDAQRRKERRVTTKWFCFQTFGVPPPYL